MWDVIIDTLVDAVKLLPFLFAAYFAMEYMEHKMGERAKETIEKSGKLGPVLGGVIGAFPQCGFSAAASNLYAGRVITLGTLLAVFLSTSDEMLPILVSEQVNASVILKLLGLKVLVGMVVGLLVDLSVGGKKRHGEMESGHMDIGHVCEHEHCRCEDGIVKSALRHTLNIFLFLILITLLLNILIYFAGEGFLAALILNKPLLGHMIAGLVGLIPNCASSVILTQLYLEGVMGLGVMMAGLFAGTGVGLVVLFRMNDNKKENAKILLLLYATGVAAGIAIDALGIVV
ncbi:MAG: arsenic efflux protein [Lachnospiraceae bacterium]|jgi:hypothetical protein|nr:arsenic efflux protein [Lachnospiraceae bacterium]